MIEIYGKLGCSYCERSKALCETRNLKFTYYQLDADFTRDELFERFPTAKTFPQIRIASNVIGGYNELVKYLEETGYTGTGHSL
jgi:glutaredoxin|tara:strand:+ start:281 stop:532 length:252 start_codon:yes stop_codon:yes gene_type:complete